MSISTLKRKTQAQYNNSSVGHPSFSLNGTRRSAGYVGQDTLGRSLIRSLSRGGALKGHGGCCGKYPMPQIKTSPEMACLNNASVVKSSSLNNNGLIMTKYRWIRRPAPYSTQKQDGTRNINDQGYYIDYLAKTTLAADCHDASGNVRTIASCPQSVQTNCQGVTKSVEFYGGAISNDEYVRKLHRKCANLDTFQIVKNTQNTPFSCGISTAFSRVPPNLSNDYVDGINFHTI